MIKSCYSMYTTCTCVALYLLYDFSWYYINASILHTNKSWTLMLYLANWMHRVSSEKSWPRAAKFSRKKLYRSSRSNRFWNAYTLNSDTLTASALTFSLVALRFYNMQLAIYLSMLSAKYTGNVHGKSVQIKSKTIRNFCVSCSTNKIMSFNSMQQLCFFF